MNFFCMNTLMKDMFVLIYDKSLWQTLMHLLKDLIPHLILFGRGFKLFDHNV